MSTFTLSVLMGKLGVLIGDDKGAYIDKYQNALNNAIEEIYPALHYNLDNTELITGNILPPFNWATTSTLDVYTEPTGTLAKTTTAGYFRNGESSAKVTASGADDAIVLDSNAYPRLLDLMDNTVSLKCWAMPEDANDAFLDIITTDSDGSDTTKSSTTACPAGVFTLLKITDYSVPDDITRLRVKLRVHTTLKYVYFDPPRLTGKTIYEYLLPSDFQKGEVLQVKLQSSSYSDDACDDLHPRFDTLITNFDEITDGGYKYLKLPALTSKRRIRLIGDCPLENMTSGTITVTLDDDRRLQLLLTYAAHLVYEMKMGVVASESVGRYQGLSAYWLGKYHSLLPRLGMTRTMPYLRIGY